MDNTYSLFHSTLDTFFHNLPSKLKKESPILLACSGGPDSVALVRAVRLWNDFLKYRWVIGHINHALRGKDSERDEIFVKQLARKCGFTFMSKRRPLRIKLGNLEEELRVKRYKALSQMVRSLGGSLMLTAHTLDDQAETILMNIMRGTGAVGLGGMPSILHFLESKTFIGRPFLNIAKNDILKFLQLLKQPFRRDRSNYKDMYLRNFLRKRIIPALEKRAPGFGARLVKTAEIVRDEEIFWEVYIKNIEETITRRHKGGRLLDFEGLLSYPPAVQRRLLRRLAGGNLLTFRGVENLRSWMNSPPSGGRFWQLRQGWMAERLSKSKGSPSAQLFWFRRHE